ncbi:exodeoxyribonuclease V subunit alpha [Nitrincola tapanii]|uniref:RecBCD enzyme subunit RecD n=1 Tax=Nitrincola tapanii TaxID=1708751 RepID=A0A5A9W3V7_9GAMM|nr:exodeoxyribonuclease V subunit alpha [Nitrincola tapanii]KAA0875292.1 exodeoxyribonuclease V subunit alpha [Nitrincola tapanii]
MTDSLHAISEHSSTDLSQSAEVRSVNAFASWQTSSQVLLDLLETWAELGWIRWLDLALARFCRETCPEAPSELLLMACLASYQSSHGHVCLDLQETLEAPQLGLSPLIQASTQTLTRLPSALRTHLTLAQCLAACSKTSLLVSLGGQHTPLVLDTSNPESPLLYLRRFWEYESQLRHAIDQRLSQRLDWPEAPIKMLLSALFPSSTQSPDWQKIACLLAIRQRFAVITGGPGTGKTTTVVKLLALLQGLRRLTQQPPLRIRLAAPTGKAAARLNASIAGQVQNLNLSSLGDAETLRAQIPTQVTTLHRLLGAQRDSRFFKHNRRHPLPAEVVVVDEASMVDLEMMAHLVQALPDNAHLILLGDKDQLASVEAGAILGRLCEAAEDAHYRPDTLAWIEALTTEPLPRHFMDKAGQALHQSITMLRQSYRFGRDSGIGQLARAVNHAATPAELEALFLGQHNDLQRLTLPELQHPAFKALICDAQQGYGAYLQGLKQRPDVTADRRAWDAWAAQMLHTQSRFQLLAALRQGESGVEALNLLIEGWLESAGWIQVQGQTWYAGRPIMITRNDYRLGLMNGDLGITLEYPLQNSEGAWRTLLRVAFPSDKHPGGIHWVLPSRLPSHETVFAMTVHKSQGSEFEHTALLLPTQDNPVLTRELVYTGITRARSRFTLITTQPQLLHLAVQRRVYRNSGQLSQL